jgi:hypothetical protein
MTSDVKPIHQLGGSTLVTAGSFPVFSGSGFCAAPTEDERSNAQHNSKSGTENEG